MVRRFGVLLSVVGTLLISSASAAEIKATSAGAVRGLMAQIIDDYSRQSGQKFDFTVGTTGQLRAIIASGWPADLIIVSAPLMAELEKTANITPGSRVDLGRVGIGIVVREGASVPDVSTADAFKKAMIRAIIASGFPADLVITSAPLMGELEKTGNLTPGSRADLGRVGLGIVVRASARVPDVSTAEGFKTAMVDAPRIAIVDPTSGAVYDPHLYGVYQRLGITDVVTKKAVMQVGGKEVAEAVAAGQAEIGVTFISEIIPIAGAKLAGPLPPELQGYIVYAAAIPKASTEPAAARAFIEALISPLMARHWTAAGFEAPK
jgi:molybdate transport system substrate-binding protein